MSKNNARALNFTIHTLNGSPIPEAVVRRIEGAINNAVKDSDNPRLVVNVERA